MTKDIGFAQNTKMSLSWDAWGSPPGFALRRPHDSRKKNAPGKRMHAKRFVYDVSRLNLQQAVE